MALTYFSYISHRRVRPVSDVYLPVNDKHFTLVSCCNHQPLATLRYRVTLLYSRWVNPCHEHTSGQSQTSGGGTEVTGLAQQLDLIAQPFRTTEWDEHVYLYISRWWHILLTCVNVTRNNMSKATFMEQCVGKWQFIWLYLVFKIKAPTLLSLQAWTSMFKCHSGLFSNQYSIYVHLITKTSLVSPKLLVRHLSPTDGRLADLLIWRNSRSYGNISGELAELWGSATSPLSLSPRIRLQEDNLFSSWHYPSELPISKSPRKQTTSQGEIWISSELNNPLEETDFILSRSEGNNEVYNELTLDNRDTKNQASSSCQSFKFPLQPRDKTGTCYLF